MVLLSEDITSRIRSTSALALITAFKPQGMQSIVVRGYCGSISEYSVVLDFGETGRVSIDLEVILEAL